MAQKNAKSSYWEDDLLFLLLKLIDYPSGNKKSFKFQEVKKLKHEETTPSQVIKFITELCKQFGDLDFENFVFIPYEDGETKETIKKTLSECDMFIQDFPKNSESISYKKIFGQKFEASDLKTLARAQLFYNRDRIIKWTNFTINVGGKFRARAILKLENYIDCFKENQLEYADRENNYYTFENHKTNGFKKIKEISDESDNGIVLKDYHLGEKHHFLEFILFLHFYHYLDLKKIELDKKFHYFTETIIKKKLLNEARANDKKSEKIIIKPLSLQTDTIWKDIVVKFIDKQEVKIWEKKNYLGKFSFANLGCINLKNKNPDKQWEMFLKMSISNGEFDLNKFTDTKTKERFRQHKMSLSKKLEKFFGLEEPFYDFFEQGKKYKLRFDILPEPILRGTGETQPYRNDIKYGDLEGFYKNQTM